MEEKLGTRINGNRTAEAVATGADTIAIGCPFCRVMLSDGLTAAQSAGEAREEVKVLDVAQMLLEAVRRGESASAAAEAVEPAPVEQESGPAAPATDAEAQAAADDEGDEGARAAARRGRAGRARAVGGHRRGAVRRVRERRRGHPARPGREARTDAS